MSWLWIGLLTIKAVCESAWQSRVLKQAGRESQRNATNGLLPHAVAEKQHDVCATNPPLMRSFQNTIVPVPPDPPRCMLEF